jgi:transaldolase
VTLALYLDSAILEEARQAANLGFVAGVTTNPSLIARTGRPAEAIIRDLCDLGFAEVFYQVVQRPGTALDKEVTRVRGIGPEQIVFKIPCTLEYLKAAAALADRDLACGLTGVFSPAQAALAAEAGAEYVIPYVNRATRLLPAGGLRLVSQIAQVLQPTSCQVLAASLKSPEEVAETLLAGSHHVSVPWAVLTAMAHHDLTDQAIAEFQRAAGA